MKPLIKPWREMTERDFVDHPAWMSWYAPDEMEDLESLGFDAQETRNVFASVNWSDDFAFPLPVAGASVPFKYLCVSARITTLGGARLVGYKTSASLAAFHLGKLYQFNRALPDLSARQAETLSQALGEKGIFPLQVELHALRTTHEFSLSRG